MKKEPIQSVDLLAGYINKTEIEKKPTRLFSWLFRYTATVLSCTAIIVFGITAVSKSTTIVTTSIGQNISTNDLIAYGNATTTGDHYIGGMLTVNGSLSASSFTASSTSATNTITGKLLVTNIPTLAHSFAVWDTNVANSNVTNASLLINPSSAASDTNLFGIAVNNNVKFMIDAEGDVFVNSLTATGTITQALANISTLSVENNATLGDAITDTVTFDSGNLIFTNTSTTTIPSRINAYSFATSMTATPILSVDGLNGRIGIGTSSPYAKLSVSGMGTFDDYVRSSYFIATSTTATSTFPYLTSTQSNLGTIVGGNWNGSVISSQFGGTGQNFSASSGLLYFNAGVASATSTLGVNIGGTGNTSFTNGSIVFSNGSTLTQNNANLFWDNANARLGIGTITPGYSLDVNGSASIQNNLLIQLEGGTYYGRTKVTENQWTVGDDRGATWTARDSSRGWTDIAVSSDGKYQTATVNNGQIYTSTDHGVTWTARDSSRTWYGIAMSSDGKYQTALDFGGKIYISADYGVTWTAKDSDRSWLSVTMSSDGKYQTVAVFNGYIYTSSDYGATWIQRDGSSVWRDVAMSSDGKYQTATFGGGLGGIKTSTDYGATWVSRDSGKTFYGTAMSSDGKYQTATVNNGQIYISTDYGVTWAAKDSNRFWQGVAISSDGKYQTAIVDAGKLYISSDYGATWTAQNSNRSWTNIAMSSDGKYQTATVNNGQIYTSHASSYMVGGNVGIGTTSPYAKLSVSGIGVFDDYVRSSYFIATSTTASSTFPMIVGSQNSGGNLWLGSTQHATKGKIFFGNSAYDEVNNRLGIGTQSPTHPLEVNGNARFGNLTSGYAEFDQGAIVSSVTSDSFSLALDNYGLTNSDPMILINHSTSNLVMDMIHADMGGGGGSFTGDFLDFNINSVNKFKVDNIGGAYFAGNVGIGTTSPYAKLSVSGNGVFDDYVRSSYFIATSTTASSTFPMIVGSQNSGGNLWLGSTQHATKGKILFGTSAYDEVNNRLGIGTQSPSYSLDVQGTTNFVTSLSGNAKVIFQTADTFLRFNQDSAFSAGVYMGSSNLMLNSGHLRLGSGGGTGNVDIYSSNDELGNKITINGSINANSWFNTGGNFGIGTSSPYAKLSVAGIGVFDDYVRSSYFIATSTTATSTFPYLTSTRMALTGLTAGSIPFIGAGGVVSQNNANLFWDNANTRMGIGTASPANPLDIVYNAGGWTLGVNVKNTIDNTQSLAGYGIKNNAGTSVGAMAYAPTNYETTALQDSMLVYSTGATPKLGFITSSGSANGADMYWRTGNNERLRLVGATGNFGIGTSSPYAKLSVAGIGVFDDYVRSSYFIATSTTASSTFPMIVGSQSSGGNLWLGSTQHATKGKILFGNSAYDEVNNRMGIASSSPFATFAVEQQANDNIVFLVADTGTSTPHIKVDGAGITYIEQLQTGAMSFDTNAGMLSWQNLPVDSSATSGTIQSYTAQIDGTNILTIYATSNGTGGISSPSVGIGTTTPGTTFAVQGNALADAWLTYDVAEMNLAPDDEKEQFEEGDLLSISDESGGFVKASQYENYPIIGVAKKIDIWNSITYKPAILGTFTLKVSTENGNIYVGDYLTKSSIPGVAMRANEGDPTVGFALAEYSGDSVAVIKIFINVNKGGGQSPVVSAPSSSSGFSLSAVWDLVIDEFKLIGITFKNGLVKAREFVGDVITAKKAVVDTLEMKDSITGETYCINIANGEWNKTSGTCGSSVSAPVLEPLPTPVSEPAPIPDPTPTPAAEPAPAP